MRKYGSKVDGPRSKWTARGIKMDGPNGWKWTDMYWTGRFKKAQIGRSAKVDGPKGSKSIAYRLKASKWTAFGHQSGRSHNISILKTARNDLENEKRLLKFLLWFFWIKTTTVTRPSLLKSSTVQKYASSYSKWLSDSRGEESLTSPKRKISKKIKILPQRKNFLKIITNGKCPKLWWIRKMGHFQTLSRKFKNVLYGHGKGNISKNFEKKNYLIFFSKMDDFLIKKVARHSNLKRDHLGMLTGKWQVLVSVINWL